MIQAYFCLPIKYDKFRQPNELGVNGNLCAKNLVESMWAVRSPFASLPRIDLVKTSVRTTTKTCQRRYRSPTGEDDTESEGEDIV